MFYHIEKRKQIFKLILLFLFYTLVKSNGESTSLKHTKHLNVATNESFLLHFFLRVCKLLHSYILHLQHFAEALNQRNLQECINMYSCYFSRSGTKSTIQRGSYNIKRKHTSQGD